MRIVEFIFYKYYRFNQMIKDEDQESLINHAAGFMLLTLFFYLVRLFLFFLSFVSTKAEFGIGAAVFLLITFVLVHSWLFSFFNKKGRSQKIMQSFKGQKNRGLEVIFWLYNIGLFLVLATI
ncbi:hypothetical protein [Microscilla marina]|uniref:Uncharacterized protein n=1 Tax=Microscilla marina ATCC 23134 TaxID=313606 RepID=A1ZUQ1_MICM2|nr:hypothetical protein [Microscilla marina]EAY25937.1 hypothetical protein M23134_00891 [Microscilla marina ATCC 23134]